MKRTDIIIIAVFLAAAVIAFSCSRLIFNKDYDKKYVDIYVKNELYKEIPIPNNEYTETVTIKNELGENIVEIKNGGAVMLDADCHDKVCVKSGFIDQPGQTIVCLPHKLVVEIKGEKTDNNSVTDDVSY